jgi:hypothetical protein
MRSIRILALGALAASLALSAVAANAGAAPKPRLEVDGSGTYALDQPGVAQIEGTATGRPISGPFTATLAADDGSLPAAGECEPGTATISIDSPRRDPSLELEAGGEVCGQFVEPPFVVTQVFTGTYLVTESPRRPLLGTDGFLEVRLTNDGGASIFAIDT